MTIAPKKKKVPDAHYIKLARELKNIHPTFKKLAKRKKLNAAEKSSIQRLAHQYEKLAETYGAGGFKTLTKTSEIKAAKKAKLTIGSFNLIKLNNYANENAPLKVFDNGNLVVQKAVHKYNTHLRQWYFHKVDFTYKPKSKLARKQQKAFYDAFKNELDHARRLQKGKRVKEFSYYLWGPRGVYYRHSAATPELLIDMLHNWISKYVPADIQQRRKRGMNNLDNVIIGFAWHANVSTFKKAPRKYGKANQKGRSK
jgi:seryl-tRNA synthetase